MAYCEQCGAERIKSPPLCIQCKSEFKRFKKQMGIDKREEY